MPKDQAGNSIELAPESKEKSLEGQYYEIVRAKYRLIHASGLDKFTFRFIDSSFCDVNVVIRDWDRLPENRFKALTQVIHRLFEARNELRLARFLFDVEEIQPVYRLIMRNRAVLRGKYNLYKALQVWPLHPSPGMP